VFAIHGAITLAGAFVLIVFPTAIPSAVGITITRPDYLLVYLVAAAELAAAVLSFGAIRITDWAALPRCCRSAQSASRTGRPCGSS